MPGWTSSRCTIGRGRSWTPDATALPRAIGGVLAGVGARSEELRAALGEVRWLKKLLAEAELDKAMLKELAEGKW